MANCVYVCVHPFYCPAVLDTGTWKTAMNVLAWTHILQAPCLRVKLLMKSERMLEWRKFFVLLFAHRAIPLRDARIFHIQARKARQYDEDSGESFRILKTKRVTMLSVTWTIISDQLRLRLGPRAQPRPSRECGLATACHLRRQLPCPLVVPYREKVHVL